jgi:hypothetical protein
VESLGEHLEECTAAHPRAPTAEAAGGSLIGGYRSGRSAHGATVRRIHKMPLITARFSRRGRERPARATRQLGQEGPNQNPLLVGEVARMRRSQEGPSGPGWSCRDMAIGFDSKIGRQIGVLPRVIRLEAASSLLKLPHASMTDSDGQRRSGITTANVYRATSSASPGVSGRSGERFGGARSPSCAAPWTP